LTVTELTQGSLSILQAVSSRSEVTYASLDRTAHKFCVIHLNDLDPDSFRSLDYCSDGY